MGKMKWNICHGVNKRDKIIIREVKHGPLVVICRPVEIHDEGLSVTL